MRTLMLMLFLGPGLPAWAQEVANPLIDYDGFAAAVRAVGEVRERRRIDAGRFRHLAALPGTVVLDARSADAYALLHIEGAVNLPLPDITADALAQLIPTPSTTMLIYCNNNFLDQPRAFPTKAPAASLNLHTLTVLHSYGYRNVHELAPPAGVADSPLEFAGRLVGEGGPDRPAGTTRAVGAGAPDGPAADAERSAG